MGLPVRQRRNADGDVFQNFNENTAQTAQHHRAEERIALDAEDHFHAFAGHALDDDAVDFCIGHVACDLAR